MNNTNPIIPLYTSRGDVEAFIQYPYIFNRLGEWIGWVTADRQVYSVLGFYVGYISDDRRILRKRVLESPRPAARRLRRPPKSTRPPPSPWRPS